MRSLPRPVGFLVAFALALTVSACSSDGDDSPQVIGSDETSETPTDGGTEDAVSEESAPEAAEEMVVESGFSTGVDSIGTRYTSAGARLTNPNEDLAAYEVQVLFNLVSKAGDVLDSSTETVPYVGPGEAVAVAPLQIGFDLKEVPSELEVSVIGDFVADEGPRGTFGGEAAVLEVKSVSISKSDFGLELSGQVSNPTDVVVEYPSWACIYVKNGKVVGGQSSAIVDPIPPGATVQFSDFPSVESLLGAEVECRVMVDL